MPALVIKDLPVELHHRLKADAKHHHRSMTQQAIVILEQGLYRVKPVPAFKAYEGQFPLTNEFIHEAKREGVLFEERRKKFGPVQFDPPVKTRTPLTDEFIASAKKEGRP